MKTDLERFEAHVLLCPVTGCHLWTGATGGAGYGYFGFKKKRTTAHRWAFENYKGPIPEGTEIDHLCRVRLCVNPDHLEAVTHRVNLLRGKTIAAKSASKVNCSKCGKPLNAINYKGFRFCRPCNNLYQRQRRVNA